MTRPLKRPHSTVHDEHSYSFFLSIGLDWSIKPYGGKRQHEGKQDDGICLKLLFTCQVHFGSLHMIWVPLYLDSALSADVQIANVQLILLSSFWVKISTTVRTAVTNWVPSRPQLCRK